MIRNMMSLPGRLVFSSLSLSIIASLPLGVLVTERSALGCFSCSYFRA